MSIGVFAAESLPLDALVSGLADEGLKVAASKWPNAGFRVDEHLTKAVLIVSSHGAGELSSSLSRAAGKSVLLILCAPQPDEDSLTLLKELGVSEVITPRSWEPEHVCERIAGHLIADGDLGVAACGGIVGGTQTMKNLFRDIATIAPLSDPVLILGESGTGKELVAAELHSLSRRPDQFLPVNCGELSQELAGSDLFGHKKGSFTGATEARRGLLAEAGRGTIFLDEIGELDLRAQSILLRVLEDRKVRRVGANQTEDINVRIVLATNRDLETECDEGRFKADLFERIRGFTIELVPLRERRADIPLLVRHFLAEYNREYHLTLKVPDGVVDCLFNYDWPGNVRELRAAVRAAAAYHKDEQYISAWHLMQSTRRKRSVRANAGQSPYTVPFDPRKDTWADVKERARQIYFPAALEAAGGNQTRAAGFAKVSSSQFYQNLSGKKTEAPTDEKSEGSK
jgi:DNA-binding NtrC family response regulator